LLHIDVSSVFTSSYVQILPPSTRGAAQNLRAGGNGPAGTPPHKRR
jgi:hypothetical protein